MKEFVSLILAFAVITLVVQAQASMVVYFIDVGQGDCTLVQSEDSVMLVDTGPPDARASLQKQLQACGVRHIDKLVLTHPHEDHDGNLGYLVDNYEIGAMYMPEYADDEEDYGVLLRRAVGRGTRIVYPSVGDQFNVGDATVTVLSAADPAQFPENKNLWSIVLKIDDGDTSIIVVGDAEDINEYAMIDTGLGLDADILRVGHHGSYTSTSGAFLDAVTPDVAVISCGVGNSYGHPHSEVLDAIFDRQIVVLRTDLNGTITATISPDAYTITKEK